MAYGNVILLTIDHDTATRLCQRLGVDWPTRANPGTDEARHERDQAIWDLNDLLGDRLREVHRDTLAARDDVGRVEIITDQVPWAGYLSADTDHGRRVVAPWSLLDAADAGDGVRWDGTDLALGVEVLGRYVPSWLDLPLEHGGSATPVVLDQALLNMADVARRAVTEVIEEFAGSRLTVIHRHF